MDSSSTAEVEVAVGIDEVQVNMKTKKVSYPIKRRKPINYSKPLKKVSRILSFEIKPSKMALIIMDDFMNDIFHRLASEAANLARIRKRKTITEKEIESAVKLVLKGELVKHALSEGEKAIAKFKASHS